MPSHFIFTLVLLVLFSAQSLAQSVDNAINQQDWITRQQQNKIEETNRLREFESIKKQRELKLKKEDKPRVLDKELKDIGKCFTIKDVELVGASLIYPMQRQRLIKEYIGECFDGKLLDSVVKKVTNFYQDRGYVSTQVLVPKQNINEGILKIEVIEGKVSQVMFGGNGYLGTLQRISAFGDIEGEILDLDDVNQGVYQINRLSSNNAIVKIQPAEKMGYSDVVIENQKSSPSKLSFSYDNLGNEFTGINLAGVNFSYDNLLSLNDNINLSMSNNLNDDNKEKDIRSFSAAISIPFNHYTLSYNLSRSNYLGTIGDTNSRSKLTGYSHQQSVTLDRLLLAKGNHRLSAHVNMTAKKTASYVEYVKQQNSERRLTIGSLSLSLSSYFDNGISLYVKPSLVRGLKLLDATQDEARPNADIPRAQYQAYKLYASLSKNVLIPKLNIPVGLSTEFSGQISENVLFGSEQFSVGGYYSVRGFRENYVTGDHGYYFRNQARFSLDQLVVIFLDKEEDHRSNKYLLFLSKIVLEPFYDYGHTQYSAFQGHAKMGAAGLKTTYLGENFTASLTNGWATQKSLLANQASNRRENKMVFFELKYAL